VEWIHLAQTGCSGMFLIWFGSNFGSYKMQWISWFCHNNWGM